MFIDKTKIYVKAGNGGNGAVSFRREKYVAAGGPDGGDGGRGGDIIFVADYGKTSLIDFKYKRKFVAENGGNGAGRKFHGKNGENTVISVPLGTVIKDADSGMILADISSDEPVVICKGGKGGFGNKHFATPTRQTPRFAKAGIEGAERNLLLELKVLADVGLVGMPSVGKSSLISKISAATPEIAGYHFTTKSPVLGIVTTDIEKSFVCADLPGLIEGASEGAGLGHQFLRHVERCRMLIHVVDAASTEGRDPVEDMKIINAELKNYSAELEKRPQIVAANKCDAISDRELYDKLISYCKQQGVEVYPISAATGEGIKELLYAVSARLETLPPVKIYEPEQDPVAEEVKEKDHSFTIRQQNRDFYVEAEWLKKVVMSINYNDYESLNYFQRVLKNSGIIAALEEKGIEDGETVHVYDMEFDFVK